jgi:hypothetical protein
LAGAGAPIAAYVCARHPVMRCSVCDADHREVEADLIEAADGMIRCPVPNCEQYPAVGPSASSIMSFENQAIVCLDDGVNVAPEEVTMTLLAGGTLRLFAPLCPEHGGTNQWRILDAMEA